MSQTKQRSAAAKNVAVFFVVFIILELLVLFGVSKVFKNKDVTPSFAGYSIYIMDSDEMGDSVPKGSLVMAANGAPSVDGIGKAFVVENVPGVGTSVFWLAGVSSSDNGLDGVIYTIYQQKNFQTSEPKIYEVRSADIVGEATSYYTTAGKIITFITSKFGIIVCIGAPLALMIFIEIILAIAAAAGKKEYYNDDDDDDTEENQVSLDDFLFGGENEKVLQKKHSSHEHLVEETSDDEESSEPDEEEQPKEQQDEADSEEDYIEEAAEEAPEEAESEPVAEAAEPEPEQQPAEEKSKDKPPVSAKPAATSLEDLMKLMEEQQQKLRDQLKN